MLLEPKILDPVCIRLGKDSNLILADKNNKEDHHLIPGALFNGEHYGFVLIVDHKGKQKEYVYPTQCKISAVGIEGSFLKIFEEGKKLAWRFEKNGELEHSAFDEFTEDFRSKFDVIVENYDMFMGEPTLQNPVRIKIALNPEESVILKDENITEDYPLCPGAMFGTLHYGFILVIETLKGEKELVYPTQNRIDAVGIEADICNDIKIFENGKYNPWLFTFDGKLKNKASYNQYSKRDNAFIEECYGLNEIQSDCFSLQKKK